MVNKIRTLVEMGVSKSYIARGIGVTPQAVGKWLNGDRTPSDETEKKFNTWLSEYRRQIAEI